MHILQLSPEDANLVSEVRQFLEAEMPRERRIEALVEQSDYQDHIPMEWIRGLWAGMAERGWLGLAIPPEYGGSGGTILQKYLFANEASYIGAPLPRTALQVVAPALLAHGSEYLKAEFLPRIARGEINFSLGYTEPDAGTDLANLKLRAEPVTGGYRVWGQKVFTTRAHRCEYIFLAARTGSFERKQAGISLFVVDAASEGVEIRPLETMHGRTNTVYFDGAFVPEEHLVGELNQGWNYLRSALGIERITFFLSGHLRKYMEIVAGILSTPRVDGVVAASNPALRSRLGELSAELMGIERLIAGTIAMADRDGEIPPASAAMIKVLSTEFKEKLADLGAEGLGQFAPAWDFGLEDSQLDGLMDHMWRDGILHTFGGGANEIQRDMVAIRLLGLPRAR